MKRAGSNNDRKGKREREVVMKRKGKRVDKGEMATHTHTHDSQSGGALHKYGANNENACGFILNTAANN